MLIIARRRGSPRAAPGFGEAAALALLGAHVELLALIDVEEEGRRLGLPSPVAALGRIEQIPQRGIAVEEHFDPVVLRSRPGGSVGSNCQFAGTVDQRLERLGAGLELRSTSAAVLNACGHARRVRRSGQAWRLSAASTPACASEDLPTPELPSRIGSLSGAAASALSTSTVSRSRPKK